MTEIEKSIYELINDLSSREATSVSILLSRENGITTEDFKKIDAFSEKQQSLYSLVKSDTKLRNFAISIINKKIFNNELISEESQHAIVEQLAEQQKLLDYSCYAYTALPTYTSRTQIVGRDQEICELKKLLESKNSVLITGFGGVGKTILAQLLFYDIAGRYDSIAWIPYKGNLKQSVLASVQLYNDIDDPETRLQAIIRKVKNDGKSKLIIIDNADHDESEGIDPSKDNELSAIAGWNNTTVIVTSRLSELEGYDHYEIGFLHEESCADIFYSYYKYDQKREHEDTVLSLVRLAYCHTYTVELFAKGANRESSSLEEYYEKLKNNLSDTDYRFKVSHHPDKATIAEHLNKLFDLQRRNEAEQIVIRVFSVLPVNTVLSKTEAKKWFDLNTEALDTLTDDGWLSFTNEYSLHPLVKDIAFLDGLRNGIFSHFLSCLEDQDNKFFSDNEPYFSIIRKREIAEAVVDSIDDYEKDSLQFGRIFNNLAFSCHTLGDYDQALKYLEKASKIIESMLGTDHPNTAFTYNNIALVYADMGDYDRALEYYEKALKIIELKLGTDHPDTAMTYDSIAGVYQNRGNYDRALEYSKKALKIREAKFGTDHPSTAITYNNIALVYQNKGDYDRALEYYEKALKIKEAKLGTDHPDTATTYNNIAGAYKDMGDYDRALESLEKALKIIEAKLGTDHPSTATTYNNIALVYEDMGNYDRALEYYEKDLKISESKLGTDHPSTATTYNNIAAVYYYKGNYDRALEYLEKALKIKEAMLGTDHPNTAVTYNNIAAVYEDTGNYDRALEYYEKALKTIEAKLGTDHPRTIATYNNIADVYKNMGKHDRALEYSEKANRNIRRE